MTKLTVFALLFSFFMSGSVNAEKSIDFRLKQLTPFQVADSRVEKLSSKDQAVLRHLLHASMIMDALYLQQMHPRSAAWKHRLERLAGLNSQWKKYRKYFALSYGPWDIFFEDWVLPKNVFLEEEPLLGRNFYPEGWTASKIETWLTRHPKRNEEIRSPYTMVREDEKGDLFAIPYSRFFSRDLEAAAKHLEAAARLAGDPNLEALLRSRAHAFRTNQYNETEKDWIAAWNSDIQLTIGPYEEYDDRLLGVKRGFGSRVALKDPVSTQDLQEYLSYIEDFQKRLPMHPHHLKDKRKASFITAVNEIFMTGESKAGVQTLAHKLPNDRSVTLKHGSRRVLFMNILEGKCKNILKPIGDVVLKPSLRRYVSCDSFKKFTLHHEIAHALGPAFYYRDIEKRTGRKRIQDLLGVWGSPVEEAKADIVGLYDRQFLFEKKLEPSSKEKEMYATYLAGIFRTVRFGAGSAHKKGIMLQFNMLREKGALFFDEKGLVVFDVEKMKSAVPEVVKFVLNLQAEGSSQKAQAALEKYGSVPPKMRRLLDQVAKKKIPRDLYPHFPSAEALLRGES